MNDADAPELESEGSVVSADRRVAERYPCDTQPFWRVGGEVPLEPPTTRVLDVSATGIGLLLPQPLKRGRVLVLTLQTGDRQLSRPLPVRVMHVTLQEDGDWLVGCQFVRPLSARDRRALLGEE